MDEGMGPDVASAGDGTAGGAVPLTEAGAAYMRKVKARVSGQSQDEATA